jgi:hypothetical protein
MVRRRVGASTTRWRSCCRPQGVPRRRARHHPALIRRTRQACPDARRFRRKTPVHADYTVEQLYQFLGSPSWPARSAKPDIRTWAPDLGHAYSKLGKPTGPHREGPRPLGMKDTAITLPAGVRSRMSVGHTAGGDVTPNWDLPTLAGAGALQSTVNDVLAFLQPPGRPAGVAPRISSTTLLATTPGRRDRSAWLAHSGSGRRGGLAQRRYGLSLLRRLRPEAGRLPPIDDIGFP